MRVNYLRTFETNQESNNWWLSNIAGSYTNGRDILNLLTYEEVVEGITPEMIRAAAEKYFSTENVARFTLLPVEQELPTATPERQLDPVGAGGRHR